MRAACWLFAVMILVAAVPNAAAQQTPDFSGRWVVEPDTPTRPDIPSALSIEQKVVRTNVHAQPMEPWVSEITIAREFSSETRSETYSIGTIGGTVSGIVSGVSPIGSYNAPRTYHDVRWQGQALVILTGSYTGSTPETGQWAERREEWSLDPQGRLHVSITTRGSPGGSRAIQLVYRRQ